MATVLSTILGVTALLLAPSAQAQTGSCDYLRERCGYPHLHCDGNGGIRQQRHEFSDPTCRTLCYGPNHNDGCSVVQVCDAMRAALAHLDDGARPPSETSVFFNGCQALSYLDPNAVAASGAIALITDAMERFPGAIPRHGAGIHCQAVLDRADPCAGVDCGAHGSCHDATGVCSCGPGYEGDRCEIAEDALELVSTAPEPAPDHWQAQEPREPRQPEDNTDTLRQIRAACPAEMTACDGFDGCGAELEAQITSGSGCGSAECNAMLQCMLAAVQSAMPTILGMPGTPPMPIVSGDDFFSGGGGFSDDGADDFFSGGGGFFSGGGAATHGGLLGGIGQSAAMVGLFGMGLVGAGLMIKRYMTAGDGGASELSAPLATAVQ